MQWKRCGQRTREDVSTQQKDLLECRNAWLGWCGLQSWETQSLLFLHDEDFRWESLEISLCFLETGLSTPFQGSTGAGQMFYAQRHVGPLEPAWSKLFLSPSYY